jgi:nucleoside-diphosphate-sugar epimerase
VQNQEVITINNAAGNPRVNPIYIEDFLIIIKKIINKRGSFRINIAGEQDYSILEIAEIIGEILDKKPIYKIVKNNEVGDLMGDISLIKKLFKFSPKTTLRRGLTKFI